MASRGSFEKDKSFYVEDIHAAAEKGHAATDQSVLLVQPDYSPNLTK